MPEVTMSVDNPEMEGDEQYQKIKRMAHALGWVETPLGWGTMKGRHATTYADSEWNPWESADDLYQVFQDVDMVEVVLNVSKSKTVDDIFDVATHLKLLLSNPEIYADAALEVLEGEHAKN